ncbi:unnamed protein product [Cuscuta epithymum]|uniref:Maf-like protein n=1 Tax=Cuscuta epithymum TaxID=186058 RepID=A0AAV0EA41_9ASTE|nr:unnamed protein product [Cuscuta epithymum]
MEANINPPFKIILGSASVPRREVLTDMGYEFTTMSADIDEKAIRKENPEDLVIALAEAKADAIISRLPISKYKEDADPTLLITCDQVVVYEGMIREKPTSKQEARRFIEDYSNGSAATVSSVLVTNLKTGAKSAMWDKVEIYFHEIPEDVMDKLIEEGELLYVAGGLLIEHPLLRPYVHQVAGAIDSVMGLPKALTQSLMKEVM